MFCADGTWNGPDSDEDKDDVPDLTNVLKLFLNLAGRDTVDTYRAANEQERVFTDQDGRVRQIAKYLHGVGDSDNWLKKALGGGFGAGVIARIVRGYTFISRHYQPGDQIFLTGFSRGAYTVRALGGLIATQGLLNPASVNLQDREEAYRAGSAAWRLYRQPALVNSPLSVRWAETIADLPGFFTRPLTSADFIQDVPIQGIGVWDTVGALGIPVFNRGNQRDLFRFVDNHLNERVENALHLVAVDERRGDFAPSLWEPRDGVTQILFPGAHADVGGGYPIQNAKTGIKESQLSDMALLCMSQWFANLGVHMVDPPHVAAAPDPLGVAHQPWEHFPFDRLPQATRQFPASLEMQVHASIGKRWNQSVVAEPGTAQEPYCPTNLTGHLDNNGRPLPGTVESDC
ncbi:MAG: DUF2235 domain-containing protein [Magnetococcus sp. DMHC-8]